MTRRFVSVKKKKNAVKLLKSSNRLPNLLQLGESQGIAVFSSELHEPHVGGMSELSDDAETGEQPVARTSTVRVTKTAEHSRRDKSKQMT